MYLLFCGLVEHCPNIITHFGIFSALETKAFPLLLQINEMTKELDALLAYIEKDGGFRDACITFQQRPLSLFEDGLQNFLELLQIFKVYDNCESSLLPQLSVCGAVCSSVSNLLLNVYLLVSTPQSKVEGQCSKIEDLRNKMFQGEPFIHFLLLLLSK